MFFEEMTTNTVNSYPEEVWKTGVVLIASQFANRIREEYSTADLSDVELANMAMAAVSAACLGVKRVPYMIAETNANGNVDITIARSRAIETPEQDFENAVRSWVLGPEHLFEDSGENGNDDPEKEPEYPMEQLIELGHRVE